MPRPTIKINKKCFKCGKIFYLLKWQEKQRIRRGLKKCFCSSKCKNKYQSSSHGPNWKNGRRKQGNYVMILVSKKKYKFEHRFVMEKHIGRELSDHEVVHHINGNPLDNRIENLVVCESRGIHTKKYHPLKNWKGIVHD